MLISTSLSICIVFIILLIAYICIKHTNKQDKGKIKNIIMITVIGLIGWFITILTTKHTKCTICTKHGKIIGGMVARSVYKCNDTSTTLYDMTGGKDRIKKHGCDLHCSKTTCSHISHIPFNSPHTKTFSNILIDKGMPYNKNKTEIRQNLHWGQLKLFLSELEFLLLAVNKADTHNQDIVCIYPGSAPGYHIKKLSEMFPKIYFELYDPRKFKVKDTNKIKTHVQLFTDEDAKSIMPIMRKKYKNPFIIFCSDIRTNPDEASVANDMKMQFDWWRYMNPDLSMFKFRLPWQTGKTSYPKGILYTQAYQPSTSTETRLVVEKDAEIIDYDNIKYEQQCYYHNKVIKQQYYEDDKYGDLRIGRDLVDNCYDCKKFIYLVEQYLSYMHRPINKASVLSMIDRIQCGIMFNKHNILTKTIIAKDMQANLYDL